MYDDTHPRLRRSGDGERSDAWRADWRRLTGQEYDRATFLEWIHPEDRERVAVALQAMFREGRFDEEYRLRGADGTFRWVESRVTRRGERWYGHIRRIVGDRKHRCRGLACFCAAMLGMKPAVNIAVIALVSWLAG